MRQSTALVWQFEANWSEDYWRNTGQIYYARINKRWLKCDKLNQTAELKKYKKNKNKTDGKRHTAKIG